MILVIGKNGQVATELQRFSGVIALGRAEVDLSNPWACAEAISKHHPNAVINAAAYTAVDKAEKEEPLATLINGYAPKAIAQVCAKLGIPLVHISTDYVFDGSGETPWSPDNFTAPQNAYGRSKLVGEIGIRESGAVYAIFRTSWVISAHGSNFVKKMLQLSKTQKKIRVVSDQIGGPTPARDIAVACLQIAEQLQFDPSKLGTYHFSGLPNISWAEFAKYIFQKKSRSITVTPVPTTDYPTLAARPLNSRLECTQTTQIFGIKQPNWRIGLNLILKDLGVR